jgi:hypothetical protein
MRKRITSILIAMGFLLVFITHSFAASDQTNEVKLEQVPAVAQKTIIAESEKAKGHLEKIERVIEDDELRYDVELATGKRTRSFSVAPDGKLLSWQVFMNEIAVPARQAIRAQVRAANGKLEEIDRVEDEDGVTFDVTMTKDGREVSFTVSKAGKLLSLEMALAETPDSVQKTIRAQTTGGEIKNIEKEIDDEDGEITYDIEAAKAGKKFSFTVDANGKLQEPDK